MNHKPGSGCQRIVEACNAPAGMSAKELREAITSITPESVAAVVGEFVRAGVLFKAGIRGAYRYFAHPHFRDAWAIEHAAEVAAAVANRALPAKDRAREKYRRRSEARKAERIAQGKKPCPKLSPEERQRRKNEYSIGYYERQRAKLGLTVKPRKPTGSPDIPTTPKKAKTGEPGRGRGIVIGKPSVPANVVIRSRPVPSGEPIETPKTVYTRCPPFVDRRYQPDPSIAGRGAITEMWLERRLREQSR